MSVSRWLHSPALRAIGAALAAAAWYAWRVEPRWLQITRLWLPVADLPPAFQGYRIVQLSDLHLGVRLIEKYLPVVVQAANREQPDLIAITGDIATDGRKGLPEGQAALARLHAPDGVWAILGNHDYAVGEDLVAATLRGAGIGLLRNAHCLTRRGTNQLVIAGIDDVVLGLPDLRAALDGAPEDSPVILLAHEPDFARIAAADPRIVLQLSGHTHGGQVRLPGLKPLILPSFGHLYPDGPYWVPNLVLYVSRGIGTGQFVMRFNCRPEMVVITLVRGPCPHSSAALCRTNRIDPILYVERQ
ncbi:MAG TPA: metallophosphoesterase [Aggregatilineaceae bacterium]|nr:metallophosphoesterase [Aggregatilineaceae bacterium]